jgi:hypothetical protein
MTISPLVRKAALVDVSSSRQRTSRGRVNSSLGRFEAQIGARCASMCRSGASAIVLLLSRSNSLSTPSLLAPDREIDLAAAFPPQARGSRYSKRSGCEVFPHPNQCLEPRAAPLASQRRHAKPVARIAAGLVAPITRLGPSAFIFCRTAPLPRSPPRPSRALSSGLRVRCKPRVAGCSRWHERRLFFCPCAPQNSPGQKAARPTKTSHCATLVFGSSRPAQGLEKREGGLARSIACTAVLFIIIAATPGTVATELQSGCADSISEPSGSPSDPLEQFALFCQFPRA